MSADVCLAAMMPASRAVWSGSPFLIAPARISRSASRDIVIFPRATASRAVTAFSETSTIRTSPRGPDVRELALTGTALLDMRGAQPLLALRQKERQRLERHREIHALQLDVRRHLQRAGREIQHGFDPCRDHGIDDGLRRLGGHGDDRNRDVLAPDDRLGTRECRGWRRRCARTALSCPASCRRAPQSRSPRRETPDSRRAPGRGCRRP